MTDTMRDIFAKPVDRAIDGVIKADDEASLRVELDEYVITGEIGQKLEQFLDAYNNYETANGVWISGFFGSGKSHLLKMLAMLLENRDVDGIRALDIFLEKLDDEPMLAGALRKAVSIPSKSILFNIDQKADVISKTGIDALLSVFQKVFDEMCGYYGKQPHIARFERQLDERGQFDAFKAAFFNLSGKPWETRGREESALERDNIDKAVAQATNMNAADILAQYRKDTHISIEDFANEVKAWIDRQAPGFRLNFFVDEVGQYIADNVKLMTNLQTIAESLNTKCKGQAWIIVTAQQAITDVVGDMTAKQENDFSKIQARFANRMPLNSADVAEVIQRRLLSKTDTAQITLGNLYDREENNLKTLFDFTDGSIRLKTYRDRAHFIASYPFPPYQYTLFQMAITSLSEHNAFEGKHSSVGERSMLGVFQEVAKALANCPVGGLATFDLMFEGIRTALKSSVQQSIQIAERNLGDPFAVRVLKALFLVKYVKGFKPTVRNIGILLLANFEADQTEQRRAIENALSRLERETYIQRNGEIYEFLTNEEKDVEAEIKALDIDMAEISKELETLVFEHILKQRKIKHQSSGYEYPFSRKLDDQLFGREYDLAINFVSPLNFNADNINAYQMATMAKDELAICTGANANFYKDLELFRQTDKYIRQARSGSPQPDRERIIVEKGEQNRRRRKELEFRLGELIASAQMVVRGRKLDIGGDEPQERISKAFQTLVDKVYTNLPMLRGVNYVEADIVKAASPTSSLFGKAGTGLTEAERDVLSHIQAQGRNGVKTSAKYLAEHFATKPYGWPDIATLCIVASLSGKGKCEARSDGVLLEGDKLASALKNSRILRNILLTPQQEFTASQIRTARNLYKDLFDLPAEGTDARMLGDEWAKSLRALAEEISRHLAARDKYPFVAALDPLYALITDMLDKPATWYITGPGKQANALLGDKENKLDKIRSFMNGAQKGIYDDIHAFLQAENTNIGYVDMDAGMALRAALQSPDCYKGSAIQSLKTDMFELKTKVELTVLAERKAAIAELEKARIKVTEVPEFQALDDQNRARIVARIDNHKADLDRITLIPELRDRTRSARTDLLPDVISELDRLAHPEPATEPRPGTPGQPAPPPTTVHVSTLNVKAPKTLLTNETDIDQYLDKMKRTLMAEIHAGRKVIV